MKNIISFSGGKDSTAMLHYMLEAGEHIHSVVFFDTGWEFPEMYDHIALVEKQTGITIIKLKPKTSLDDWLLNQKIIARKGERKGKIHKIGCGWPSMQYRWCTRIKINTIQSYVNKHNKNIIECIGLAYNETKRKQNSNKRYPLIEYKKTEQENLEYCYSLGYTWGGLYVVIHGEDFMIFLIGFLVFVVPYKG